jgi:hypothetical protein
MSDIPRLRYIYIFNDTTAQNQLQQLLAQYAIPYSKQTVGLEASYVQYQITCLQSDVNDIIARSEAQYKLRIFYTNDYQAIDFLTNFPPIQVIAPKSGTGTYGAVTVLNTATLVIPANANRISANWTNNSAETLYEGLDNTVTTATGRPVFPGGVSNIGFNNLYTGAIYVIAAVGPANVRYEEVS